MRTTVCVLALSLTAAANAGGTVPFRATIDTAITPVGPCGLACFTIQIGGTGEGSHLGALEADGPSNVVFVTQSSGSQTGTSTLVGADGSSFVITFAGTAQFAGDPLSDPVTFEGAWSAGSGAGRFTGVTGSGTYHGSADGGTGVLFLEGVLTNPGKKR
jgi:hypothetical protein